MGYPLLELNKNLNAFLFIRYSTIPKLVQVTTFTIQNTQFFLAESLLLFCINVSISTSFTLNFSYAIVIITFLHTKFSIFWKIYNIFYLKFIIKTAVRATKVKSDKGEHMVIKQKATLKSVAVTGSSSLESIKLLKTNCIRLPTLRLKQNAGNN